MDSVTRLRLLETILCSPLLSTGVLCRLQVVVQSRASDTEPSGSQTTNKHLPLSEVTSGETPTPPAAAASASQLARATGPQGRTCVRLLRDFPHIKLGLH
jgi:hypothetical protein